MCASSCWLQQPSTASRAVSSHAAVDTNSQAAQPGAGEQVHAGSILPVAEQ